ncbi:hypothetical protein ACOVJP_06365 [Scardovia wiggsiae]|uniref:hypothetical protein n=1 Tax=Scardovia wiggsiae TaxID=230143 RepID=UPI003BAD9319
MSLFLCVNWQIVRAKKNNHFILNDIGLAHITYGRKEVFFKPELKEAIIVPFDPSAAFIIYPRSTATIAHYDKKAEDWMVQVHWFEASDSEVKSLNSRIRQQAHDCVFSTEKLNDSMFSISVGEDSKTLLSSYAFEPFDCYKDCNLRIHEFEWYGLSNLALAKYCPEEAMDKSYFNHYLILNKGSEEIWTPPIVFIPVDSVTRSTGVSIRGDELSLSLN